MILAWYRIQRAIILAVAVIKVLVETAWWRIVRVIGPYHVYIFLAGLVLFVLMLVFGGGQ